VGKKNQQIICFCNNISKEVIVKAIQDGAQTLNEIYDATTAGVGPCGGSCRRKIAPILEHFLETGKILEEIPDPKNSSSVDKK
jgi:bacterioferritin-associated ferredoxin